MEAHPTHGWLSTITNITKKPVAVRESFFGNDPDVASDRSETIAPGHTEVLDLEDVLNSIIGTPMEGGLRLSFRAPNNGIIVDGGLEDSVIGFSAHLPLVRPMTLAESAAVALDEFEAEPSGNLASPSEIIRMSSVGIMVGHQDPALGFPADLDFRPFLLMRNTTAFPKIVSLAMNYMLGDEVKTVPRAEIPLPANASRRINADDLVRRTGLAPPPGYLNLLYSFKGQASDVLIAAGAIDQTGSFVSEAPPKAAQRSVARTICYWQHDNGVDSMITLLNDGRTTEDLVLTFSYEGGSYTLPVHLAPRASRMLDVGDLIAHQTPDAEGHVLPASAKQGSAKLMGSRGELEHIHVAIGAGSYNPSRATCNPRCNTCNLGGYVDVFINPGPLFFDQTGVSQQLTATGQVASGKEYDITRTSSWGTTNNAVSSVSSSGLVTALDFGSDFTSLVTLQAPYQTCGAPAPQCTPAAKQTVDTSTIIAIPTSAVNSPLTTSTYKNQPVATCDGTILPGDQYGYQSCLTYQILDQERNPINAALPVHEQIDNIFSSIPKQQIMKDETSNTYGQFPDRLGVFSNAPLPTNYCSVDKQTIYASGFLIRVNCLVTTASSVGYNDITVLPNSCVIGQYYHCP